MTYARHRRRFGFCSVVASLPTARGLTAPATVVASRRIASLTARCRSLTQTALKWSALLLLCVAASSAPVAAAQAPNYQGLWWEAPPGLESGWGINFAHQGDIIFATWFTYDATGKAWWLTMTANKTAANTYAGAIYQTRGPAFNAVPFNPSQVTATPVGLGTVKFTSPSIGAFSYTVNGVSQTKAITREVFGTMPTCVYGAQPDLALATNYQDLWWAAPAGSESGWGINLTHQGDTIFASWFTYDIDGTPMWLVATAPRTPAGTYTGVLYRTGGPAFNAVPFDPAKVVATPVGSATFTFADGNAATFAYVVNGVAQSKNITRQVFAAPGTVCQNGPPGPLSTDIRVTNATDVVNGDTSSPAALAANPGPDGISLREAVLAANHAPGPHTITFDPSLSPIMLRDPLIFIQSDGTTVEGHVDAQGNPLTILDCSAPATGLVVVASSVTIRHLAFANKSAGGTYLQVSINWRLPDGTRSPLAIGGILIEDNSFSGGPLATTASGIRLLMEDRQTANGRMSNVTIRRNLFENMYGDTDAIGLGADGTGTETTDITIANNTFRQIGYAVEAGSSGTGNAIRRISFVRNDVRGAWAAVTVGFSSTGGSPSAFGNVIEDLVISNNVIADALYHAVALGTGNADPPEAVDHNIVQRVSIANNLLLGRVDAPGGFGTAINLGANGPRTTNGHIRSVQIVNNTIAGFQASCCALFAKADPSTGSSIEDVTLRNTILWNNHWDAWWISASLAS